jgi:hypothetical protein
MKKRPGAMRLAVYAKDGSQEPRPLTTEYWNKALRRIVFFARRYDFERPKSRLPHHWKCIYHKVGQAVSPAPFGELPMSSPLRI